MEVDRVRMGRAVREGDADAVALLGSQRGAWNAVVVGPRGVLDAGRDLDLPVARHELELPQRPPAREAARLSGVEVAHEQTRVEAVGLRVHRPLDAEMAGAAAVSTARARGAVTPRAAALCVGERVVDRLVRHCLVQRSRCCRGGGAPADQLSSR